MAYPEKHLYEKAPYRPRHDQGMTQPMKGRQQHKIHMSPAGRIERGKALRKALMGVKNKKHHHDGSK